MDGSGVDGPRSVPTRRLGWFLGLTVAALAVLSVYFIVDAVRTIGTLRQERAGTVSVTRCEFLTFGQRSDTYSCQGLFTSNDAELRLQPVTFDHAGDLDPGTRVAASVSGPDDGTATVGGTRSVGMRVVGAVVSVAGLVAVLLRSRRLLRARRSSRVGATRPDPDTPAAATEVAQPVDTGPGTPSLGATRIVWTHTGDGEFPYRAVAGGQELTVRVNDFPAETLYTVIVDGVETEDLEDWPPGWTRPRVPAHLLASTRTRLARRLASRVDAHMLYVWAERLCRHGTGNPAFVVTVLGLFGQVVPGYGGATVEPPPAGVRELQLRIAGQDVDHVYAELVATVPMTQADLDASFGPGERLPRVYLDSPYPITYRLEVPGTRYACDVSAYFAEEPTATSPAIEVVLRPRPVV
ncbi:hypothetical protein OG792_22190 [Micromonospora sp. NBC_01699]|uniref:hypothetical protein n=1 Tax=Micromonospora sp. NBC_01699 TaxID=2975984 RepID=UPI002E2968F6|nr:hypothetical protein [Micromonospora sp. NBC_01699]